MNIDLSPIDRRKVKNLGEVLEMNNEVLGLMSRYLTVCPDFITKELIEGITGECEITLAEAYTSLLVAACGLDVENNPRDRYLSTAYLLSLSTGMHTPYIFRKDALPALPLPHLLNVPRSHVPFSGEFPDSRALDMGEAYCH